MDAAAKEALILDLHAVEAVKLGSFVLKSGITSPIYLDLRVLVSHPRLLASVASLLRTHAPLRPPLRRPLHRAPLRRRPLRRRLRPHAPQPLR